MIKIAICDDEPLLLSANKGIVEQYVQEHKIIAQIEECTNGSFLLADVEEGRYYDLILLDIEMPERSGMEIAPKIRKVLPNCLIIFVTSYLKYAVDSFALSIFRYIPKQELEKRLPQALQNAFQYINIEQQEVYTI